MIRQREYSFLNRSVSQYSIELSLPVKKRSSIVAEWGPMKRNVFSLGARRGSAKNESPKKRKKKAKQTKHKKKIENLWTAIVPFSLPLPSLPFHKISASSVCVCG